MAVLYLLAVVFLAKVVLDSPVGRAMADSLRNRSTSAASSGSVSQAEIEQVRQDVEELRDRVDRIVEEQSFITRLLTESRPMSLGPGEVKDEDVQR